MTATEILPGLLPEDGEPAGGENPTLLVGRATVTIGKQRCTATGARAHGRNHRYEQRCALPHAHLGIHRPLWEELDDMQARWPTGLATQVTGTTERQLEYWRRRGHLAPTGKPTHLRWSFDDLVRAHLFRFISMGRGENSRHGALENVARTLTDDALRADYLLVRPYVAPTTPEAVAQLCARGNVITVFPLVGIRARLRAALSDLGEVFE